MLHLANPHVGPPGSFKARCADLALKDPGLATIGPFHAFRDLEVEWNKRRTANGLPPLSSSEIQHHLCQHLPPGWCVDEHNQPTHEAGSMSLTLADVARGTSALITWWRNGRQRVTDDEIVRRTYICNQCPLHVPVTGCQGCSGNALRAVINEIVANRSLPTDAMLGACSVCKCSLKAKTRLVTKDALSHMPAHQQRQLWHKCWLREGSEQLNINPGPD
jgi:hypothetical protein